MMADKHTPGPWTVNGDTAALWVEGRISEYHHENITIAQIVEYGSDSPYAVTVPAASNARLIASAPALLKALKAAGELWSYLPFDSGADIQEVAQRVAKLQRAAIQQAQGAA